MIAAAEVGELCGPTLQVTISGDDDEGKLTPCTVMTPTGSPIEPHDTEKLKAVLGMPMI